MTVAIKTTLVLLLVGCAPIGCNQQAGGSSETSQRTSSSTQATEAHKVPATSPATLYKDADLPVAADFEAEAEQEIDRENYLERLSQIEKALDDATHTQSDQTIR